MIPDLSHFDRTTAAGILARAALSLVDSENPAVAPRIPQETELRELLFAVFRKQLGVSSDDQSPSTLVELSDLLDQESDRLIGQIDSDSALKRLSERGELPSDLFTIRVIKNIQDFHGKKFQHEKELIEWTVRAPDKEQHFGPAANPDEPFLISLFAKYFPDQYPLRSFTLLVAGQRNDLLLDVHQAWRIYHDHVDLEGATDLVEMLRRFADKFGAEIELGGKKGHFLLVADIPKDEDVKLSARTNELGMSDRKSKRTITFSCFFQRNPLGSSTQAALAIGVDLDRYANVLRSKGW